MQVLFSLLCFLVMSIPARSEFIEEQSTLLGQEIGVRQSYEPSSSQRGVTSETEVRLFGKNRSVMKSQVENSKTEEGEATVENDLYIGGMRVWSASGKLTAGGYVYAAGIAPTQMAWPLFTYPLGPVLLHLDAGLAYQAAFLVRVVPQAAIPVENTRVKTELKAQASAAGYLEGYAQLVVIRGGVGGSIDLIDGYGNASAEIALNPDSIIHPTFEVGAKLSLLRGRIYGFVDTYRILRLRWKRILNLDLFVYEGKCWALGAEKCETP